VRDRAHTGARGDAAVGLTFIQAFGAAFPNLRYQVEEVIVAGDRVTTRWRATGTHVGTFLGIDPSGRAVTMHGISVFALRDGRIAEVWSVWDRAGLIEQLTAP
jgi:steroid delta-isomerase-like uncharacterized protein